MADATHLASCPSDFSFTGSLMNHTAAGNKRAIAGLIDLVIYLALMKVRNTEQ